MRTKVTLVLLLLNVALLAVILYARREWIAEQDLALRSRRVFNNEVIGITSIEISSGGSPNKIRLERASESTSWELKSPIQWPANEHAVRRIIQELEFLEPQTSFLVEDLAENNQSLADYGLSPAQLTLTFSRPARENGDPGRVTRVHIGDTTKVGGRLYILSPDEKTVHVVSRKLADTLIVGMEELRTDALFTIPVFETRTLGLQNPAPAPRVRLRHDRDTGRWSFEAPIVARASKIDAERVVGELSKLRALDFLNDAPTSVTGLDKPSLRVTLEGNTRRETLLLGNPYRLDPSVKLDPTNPIAFFYAAMEGRPQVFITSLPDGANSLLDTLRRAQETLRETRILDFDPAALSAISLSAPGQPEPLVLRRADTAPGAAEPAGWRIERGAPAPALPADSKLVNNLVQRLALLTAVPPARDKSPFLRDAPSAAEIEAYGFNLPQREIVLMFSGSTQPITLQLGVSGSSGGGTVQARVLGQPFIYNVAPDTLNELPVAANVYRERTLSTLPEGARITGLVLSSNDDPEKPLVSFTLEENQTWETVLAGETESRRAALNSLLEGLATLRANRFVSDTFTETTWVDGARARWKYTLAATVTQPGAASPPSRVSLQIAPRSGGGTQLAGSRELGVVFTLEQAMLDALWTLTYEARDPGPPPSAKPAANDAAAP